MPVLLTLYSYYQPVIGLKAFYASLERFEYSLGISVALINQIQSDLKKMAVWWLLCRLIPKVAL